MKKSGLFVLIFAGALLVSACARGKPVVTNASSSPSGVFSPSPAPSGDCGGSSGGSSGRFLLAGIAVGAGAGGNEDIVTFSFQEVSGASGAGKVPSYRVELARPPFTEDPSDRPLTVAGAAFARIVFINGSGVDLGSASPRVIYTGSKDFHPGLPVIAELREAGDFEGQSTWIAGLNYQSCWAVTSDKEAGSVSIHFPHRT